MLSGACTFLAFVAWDRWPVITVVAIWIGLSFLLLALAYFFRWPSLLGKRSTGGRWFWAWPIFAPYYLMASLSFAMSRRSDPSAAYVRVGDRLYLGRLLDDDEAAAAVRELHWIATVDLSCEFPEAMPLRDRAYLSVPLLDATAPTSDQLHQAVHWLIKQTANGPAYVHCTLGHGRGATIAAAYLAVSGEAEDARQAVAMVKAARPQIKLHSSQWEAIQEIARRSKS